jgi:hypothetical protein
MRFPAPTLGPDEREISFGALPPLPVGWHVIQLDSGHYMATDGNRESAITVNRYHARKWAFDMARK